MRKTLVVNLFAGPGSGKSTSCAQIFSELKWNGVNTEMALEYAKDKVWEESLKVLENQVYVFGKQLQRMKRLEGKVDVIVTDSPLLFSIIYDQKKNENFKKFVLDMHNEFCNFNIFLERVKPYVKSGRLQDEDGARDIDKQIKRMLEELGIPYSCHKGTKENVSKITGKIMDILNDPNNVYARI